MEYVDKGGEEGLKNNFRGEMSALFFGEVNAKTSIQFHAILSKIYDTINIEDLFQLRNQNEVLQPNILEKIFMMANPKYTSKQYRTTEKVYLCHTQSANIPVFNNVERVYQDTKILHNTPARDVFINIGGVRTLFLLFHKLTGEVFAEQQDLM